MTPRQAPQSQLIFQAGAAGTLTQESQDLPGKEGFAEEEEQTRNRAGVGGRKNRAFTLWISRGG